MRRPLCAAALVYCLAVFALLQILPPEAEDFSAYDRTVVLVQGTVVSKEYKVSEDGSTRLLITLKSCTLDGCKEQPQGKVLCRVGDGTKEDAEAADDLARIGSTVRIRGKLYVYSQATNAGEFDARLYYQILGYTSFQLQSAELIACRSAGLLLDDMLYRMKRFLSDVLDEILDEEDAQILKAMLLGERGELSQETKDLYQSSGIIHILAISGLHISIIGMGLFRLLRILRIPVPLQRPCKRRQANGREESAAAQEEEMTLCLPVPLAASVSVLVMILYGRMTGMSASSFRAITMFLLRMLAMVRHRTYDMLTGVCLAALLILVQQPLYLYHTGFLFSFSAVLAIALISPVFESRLMQALSVTLGTLPVHLSCYSTFPIYSIALNLVVLPLMSSVMVSGLLALALGSICTPAGEAIGVIVHVILLFYRVLCTAAGSLPGHQINVGAPYTWELLAYLGLLAAVVLTRDRTQEIWRAQVQRWKRDQDILCAADEDWAEGVCPRPGWRHRANDAMRQLLIRNERIVPELLRTFVCAVAVVLLCLRVQTGLSLHVIDVGQGDGILLRSREATILIDGGSTSKSDVAAYQLTPLLEYYGVRKLDYVIITHPDSDHMSGALEVIRQSRTHRTGPLRFLLDDSENGLSVGALCLPSAAESSQNENYQELIDAAEEKNIPVMYLKEGDVIEGENLRLVCLHPESDSSYEDANEMSVTLWLEYGSFTALLTGDLEGEGEERLLDYLMQEGRCLLLQGDKEEVSSEENTCTGGTGNAAGEEESRVADAQSELPISVTLLKVAHHGSGGATSQEFLSVFHPRLAVISCGVNNSYGHPHSETLERLSEAGVETIYDTRTGGEIIFHTDGTTLRITQHGGAME